jgi:hypothetical protein
MKFNFVVVSNLLLLSVILRFPGYVYVCIGVLIVTILYNRLKISSKYFPLLTLAVFFLVKSLIGTVISGADEPYYIITLLISTIFLIAGISFYSDDLINFRRTCFIGLTITLVILIIEVVFGFHFPGSRFYGQQVWYAKPTAFYYNENDVAFVLVFLNIILLDSLGNKIKYSLVIFSLFIFLYIGSKAALLSVISVLILHFIYRVKNKIRLSILLFIILACSTPYIMNNQFFIEIFSRTFERFNEFYQGIGADGGDTSTKDRFLIYEAAISMIGNDFFRFLFGYESFDFYRANLLLDTSAPLADFHNINFELIVMFGIFGFLLFLMYVFYLSFSLFRTGDIYSSLSLLIFIFLSTLGPSSTFRSAIIWVLLLYFTIKVRNNISN